MGNYPISPFFIPWGKWNNTPRFHLPGQESTNNMKRCKKIINGGIFVSLLIVPAILQAASSEPVTLVQCYAWTLERSEALKIRYEDIVQANARARSALGGALPYISWEWSSTWQDPDGVDELNRQGFSGFVEKKQTEGKFRAEQPLFSGLREFSARAGFKREAKRDELLYQRAKLDLYQATAEAFYAVVAAEAERENVRAALGLGDDRVAELREFRKLGKARDTEVASARAQAAALKGRLDQLNGVSMSAREELSFLTGRDLLNESLADQISDRPVVPQLNELLELARARTDLRAQRENVLAHKLRVRYERGAYWPEADVTGNYYTERETFLKVIDWDVMLTLEVPIFQGGSVSANVREALSAYRQALLKQEEMERRVLYSVRRTHNELLAAIQETSSMSEAAEAAQQSYDALKKESGFGLVTNLEMLQALDLLQEQRTLYDNARYRMKQLYLNLNVAVEKMP